MRSRAKRCSGSRATASARDSRCWASRGASCRWSCCSRTATASTARSAAGSPTRSGRAWSSSGPGQTSMQAGGERAGKRVRLTIDDAHAVAELPLVRFASPELVENMNVAYGTKQSSYLVRGVSPEYGVMRSEYPAPGQGRFLSAEDTQLHRRVAFIGSEVNRKLFGQADRRRPDHPPQRHGLRGDWRHERQGAAVELLPPRQGEHLHPLHRGQPAVVPAVAERARLAGRRSDDGAEGRQGGARAARQAPWLQRDRRTRAARRLARPRPRRSRAE